MANHKGSEGLVKIGADTIAEVKDWSFDETADTTEDTYSVTAIITSVSRSASFDGMVEASFSWDSNGAVVVSTI